MRKLLAILAVLMLAPGAEAAVAVVGTPFSGVSGSANYTITGTCPAGTTVLVVFEGNAGSTGQTVSSITAGGSAMTNTKTVTNAGSPDFEKSSWVLYSPTTGSAITVSVVLSAPNSVEEASGVCLSGTATSATFGTWASNASTLTSVALITATGASSTGLYLGSALMFSTAITSGGANGQTQLVSSVNIATSSAASTDDIPGANTGAFTWTGGGTVNNGWADIAVPVNAVTPGQGPSGFAISPSN